MQNYNKIIQKLSVAGSKVPFGKPEYFKAAEQYLSAIAPTNDALVNQGKFHQASDERRSLIQSFSITTPDFIQLYFHSKNGEKPMHTLLESVFEYNKMCDPEVARRYEELKYVQSKFEEVLPNVYVCMTSRTIFAIFPIEGRAFAYEKRKGSAQIVKEGEDVYIAYGDGSVDCICEDGTFSDDCRSAEIDLQKGYVRVDIESMRFRIHLLCLLLTYGIDLVKHTLGRFSLLTIDHIIKGGGNNELRNLQVVTRMDNTLLKTNPDHMAFNFLMMDSFAKKKLRSYAGYSYANPIFLY